MSLAIVSAIIVGATTLICCPFIRQLCEAIENVQSEKSKLKNDINTENCVTNANTNSSAKSEQVQQNVPIKPPRVFKLSCEKGESMTMCKEKNFPPEFRVNCDPTSYDNGRLLKLVDQVFAITTAVISYLESREEAGLQAVTTFLKSHSSSLPVSNELQKQTPVSGIVIDSSKSVSQIPELEVPTISITGSKTNLKNLQNNYSLANHAVIEDNEIDYLQLPTHTKFAQDMKSKEKDRNYMQSTLKIDSKSKKKNTLFKKLRKCVQPLSTKFRQYFCRKRQKQEKC
ncbi:uncharacterized protein LOC105279024 isoform X2 [Ooceraea biroi]|uniref:uncharacterized protein LOC105279024 isoform X2 n=1 Tax=Ooceraea biroi TaxID=2015173 RepID=UPI000F089F6D|nr:uncharacterized protein LOC105279024 isoform X2 [Ooceraea biroi]